MGHLTNGKLKLSQQNRTQQVCQEKETRGREKGLLTNKEILPQTHEDMGID